MKENMAKPILLSLIAFALSGCMSTYQLPPSAKTADFYLLSESDTPKGSTLSRGTYFWVFKDEYCARSDLGIRSGRKFEDNSVLRTENSKILAGEKFAFTARYVEGRFGQHRTCSVTAAFLPKQDHNYKASLQVRGEVSRCNLEIYDETSGSQQAIEFTKPKFVCLDKGASTVANGRPVWTNVTVTVTTQPVGK